VPLLLNVEWLIKTKLNSVFAFSIENNNFLPRTEWMLAGFEASISWLVGKGSSIVLLLLTWKFIYLKTSFMQHLSDIFQEWPVYLVHMLLLFSTILASHQGAAVWIWSLNLMISSQVLFHCATSTDPETNLL